MRALLGTILFHLPVAGMQSFQSREKSEAASRDPVCCLWRSAEDTFCFLRFAVADGLEPPEFQSRPANS